MTIRLFCFPLLVYNCIVKQMDLPEILALSTTSKKANAIMRCCLSQEKCKLVYEIGERLEFTQKYNDGTERQRNTFQARYIYIMRWRGPTSHIWKLSNQEIVGVCILKEKWAWIKIYWNDDKLKALNAMLLHMLSLFPKLRPKFVVGTVQGFQNSMALVEDMKIEEIYVNRDYQKAKNDDLIKLTLDECRNVPHLWISCKASSTFGSETQPPPFKGAYLVVEYARWITKDYMINLFLTCTGVELTEKVFDDEDLSAIFAKWIEDSPIEYLYLLSSGRPYRGKSLTNVVGHFPGAQVVRKARINNNGSKLHVVSFREGRCYLLEQHNGNEALVYQFDECITLSFYFRIGEDVDRMEVEFEEQEEEQNVGNVVEI